MSKVSPQPAASGIMRRARFSLADILVSLVGALEALLLARLLARLLAARPENSSIALIYALSEPLRAPLAFLDRGQPIFGATLELSTLVVALTMPVIAYLLWRAANWRR